MASTHTLTGNVYDLTGATLGATGVRVTVVTNLPAKSALIDKTTNSIHLGGKHADLDPSTGLFTIDLIDTSATDLNVAANTLQYEVRAEYVNPATRVRSTWTSGWFPFTADANLADITTDVEPLAVESASGYALEAKGYRDEAATISGLTGEDAAVAFLVEDSGSATAGALSATYVAAVVMTGTGIDDTGATDSTTAIQAKIDAAVTAGAKHIHFPDGTYKHNGTLTISSDDTEVTFSGGAWLQPTTGAGLTITGSRVILHRPRIRIDGGTPTAGIKFSGSGAARGTVNDPVVWAYSNVPANLDAIVFDDNCYWGRVVNPKVRKNSGALTGTFRRGVSFTNLANAGSVNGGDITNSDTGVYVEDSNHCKISLTDLEGVTVGVEGAGAGQGPGGLRILGTRHEAGTSCVKLSSTATSINAPVVIDLGRVSSVTNLVDDVNGLGYVLRSGARTIVVPGKALGDGLNARTDITVGDAQTESPWVLKGRSAFGTMAEWDKNGNLHVLSDAAGFPTVATTRAILRHYGGNTSLYALNPASSNGRVILGVGNGSGANKDIIGVGTNYLRPEADNSYNLGQTANRFAQAFVTGGTIKALVTVTGNTSLNSNHYRVIGNGSSITVTLPDPTGVFGPAGREFVVKNINATALTVVSGGTSKTIDGAASKSLAQWEKATYVSDGTQWLIVA